MINNQGYIIHKVGHKKVKMHDYDVYKKNHSLTPKDVVNVFDIGYLGVKTDFPEQLSVLPYKKKINSEISQKEKSITKFILKKNNDRAHLCRLKKYRIMSDIFRNKLRKYNKVSDIVAAGLVNYRILNYQN